ncbi:cytochrome P450 [Mycena galopus ATCC 62051]|nr:cytochrome P450 [Mycena galopus ATCC 62051]
MEYATDYRTIVVAFVALLGYILLRPSRGSLQGIPGPPSPSWIFGHMLQLLLPLQYGQYEFVWLKLYGPVYTLKGCLGQRRLMVSDPFALQYILNSPYFIHGPVQEKLGILLFGKNNLHVLQGVPAFTAAVVRSYMPLFEKIARQMTEELEEFSGQSNDMCTWMSNVSLSVISEDAIGTYMPWLLSVVTYLPTSAFRTIHKARYLADWLGTRVVREKLEAAKQGLDVDNDIYGMLLNSKASSRALSAEQIIEQTGLILTAGQDTTANTMTFGLVELAKQPDLQEQLRNEIHSTLAASRTPAYDSMPLLNAFIKEVLRMYPGEPITDRIALENMVLPLADSITSSRGETISHILIRKGQSVTLGIGSYQRLESRWGADAHTFKPSRWLNSTPYQGEAIGPYANLLVFPTSWCYKFNLKLFIHAGSLLWEGPIRVLAGGLRKPFSGFDMLTIMLCPQDFGNAGATL